MRTFKIIGLAGFVFLCVSSLLVLKLAFAIEKAKYTVLEKEDGFEIRKYDPQIVAETFVEGDLENAGNQGFRRLFDYISGENTKKQSISMTAPVSQETGSKKIAMTAPVTQKQENASDERIRKGIPKWFAETISSPAFVLYPINVDGSRGQAVAVPVKNGEAVLELKADYQTIFYEIETK